jgi:hypothetical protein
LAPQCETPDRETRAIVLVNASSESPLPTGAARHRLSIGNALVSHLMVTDTRFGA